MSKEIADKFRSLQIATPSRPLEGCPEDLRKGITDYWKGRGISMELLDRYYNLHGSIIIRPSRKQLRVLYPY